MTGIPGFQIIPNSNSSSLRFVLVRAEFILGAGNRIVRPAFVIDTIAMRIPVLLIERRVTFNRSFVNVGIPLLLDCH